MEMIGAARPTISLPGVEQSGRRSPGGLIRSQIDGVNPRAAGNLGTKLAPPAAIGMWKQAEVSSGDMLRSPRVNLGDVMIALAKTGDLPAPEKLKPEGT